VDFSSLLLDLLGGIAVGLLYFLIAAGFTVIFGVLGILNFAHGSLFLLAAYIITSILDMFQGTGVGFLVAAVSATIALGLLAVPIEMFLLRPIYKAEHLYQVLLTFGLALFLEGVMLQVWGSKFRVISLPPILSGSLAIGGRAFPIYYIFIIFASLLAAFALWVFLYRTNIGRVSRAAAMDKEISEALGLNVPIIFTIVFCLGTMLAALGAGLGAGLRTIMTGLDIDVLLISLVVVIIGGVGSIKGAFIAALLLGIFESLAARYFQSVSMAIPYILLVGVLLWRPHGLFGRG
jgi:branched-chain amino acid transport system permease protein